MEKKFYSVFLIILCILCYCSDVIIVFYTSLHFFVLKFLIALYYFLACMTSLILQSSDVRHGSCSILLTTYNIQTDRLLNLTTVDLRQVANLWVLFLKEWSFNPSNSVLWSELSFLWFGMDFCHKIFRPQSWKEEMNVWLLHHFVWRRISFGMKVTSGIHRKKNANFVFH